MSKVSKYIVLIIMGLIIFSIFYFHSYAPLYAFSTMYVFYLLYMEYSKVKIIKEDKMIEEEYLAGLAELRDQYKIMWSWFKKRILIKQLVFFSVFQISLMIFTITNPRIEVSIMWIIITLSFWFLTDMILYCTLTGLSVFCLTTLCYIKCTYLFKLFFVAFIKDGKNQEDIAMRYAKVLTIYNVCIDKCSKDGW